jgi:hypothetical protein
MKSPLPSQAPPQARPAQRRLGSRWGRAGLLVAAVAVVGTSAMLAASPVHALPPADQGSCPTATPELDKYEQLRATSLDLRGNVPTMQEYAELDTLTALPANTIDKWLNGADFAAQAVRVHRDMMWNSISNVRPFQASTSLRYESKIKLWWRSGGAFAFKARGNRVVCLNEPVSYDSGGDIVYKPQVDGTKREGYVMVTPYWAPDTKVKVCAGDAQAGMTSPNGVKCDTLGYGFDPACGCGPNLRWCITGALQGQITRSWAMALDMQVRDIIQENRPYTDLFTEKVAYVNGPIVFFWRFQAKIATRLRMTPAPLDDAQLPYLKWTDVNKWVKIKLGPEHAGILTTPAFLLRFQTNRARANRFYNTFLCQPFQPPESGIPVSAADVLKQPDLQKRAGCKYCHALLEPVASFWGRWTETGAGYLDPGDFPSFSAKCEKCAKTGQGCTNDCKRYYFIKALSQPEKDFLGVLKGYVFLQPVHEKNVSYGPKLMALEGVADGRLTSCIAETTARRLLGRELSADERLWAKKLAVDFAQSNYSYRNLVQSIVTSPVYRRVR